MKTIKLSVEQAKELYNTNKEFRNTILHEFTDSELGIVPILKNWEDLEFENKVYPNYYGDINVIHINSKPAQLAVPTKKHAKSMIAFAKLSMLIHDLEDECNVDWNNEDVKYVIDCYKNTISKGLSHLANCFLAFKKKSIRDAFLDKHERLIKDYFMID